MTPDRLATLKEKYPDRATRLDHVLAPLMGMKPRQLTDSPFARESMNQVQQRLLAAIFGDPDDTN